MREERTAPRCFGVADTSADDLRRQAANRAPAKIEQSRLAREGLTLLRYTHDVTSGLSKPARTEYVHVGTVGEQVEYLPAQTSRRGAQIHLCFDDHPAADDVEPTGKAQQRGDLCLAAADLSHH